MQWHRFALFVVGVSVLALNSASTRAADKLTPVKIEKEWHGEVKLELRKLAPESGYIVSEAAWRKLWEAYRGKGDLPPVDFSKELILVAVNKDPNTIFIRAALDDQGNLQVMHGSTLIGFLNPTTCSYQFALIKRDKIKTIQGKPIAKE